MTKKIEECAVHTRAAGLGLRAAGLRRIRPCLPRKITAYTAMGDRGRWTQGTHQWMCGGGIQSLSMPEDDMMEGLEVWIERFLNQSNLGRRYRALPILPS
mmetsp:Transcript_12195/g.29797  ORF Transcript_12195/g.29797 Transcript_12195/m.29797 type:complete len:100 (-) Transcript_12195:174-473(-)